MAWHAQRCRSCRVRTMGEPMSSAAILEAVMALAVLAACIVPLGRYMQRVFEGAVPRFASWLRPVESLMLRMICTRPDRSSTWKRYAVDLLLFNGIGCSVLLIMQLMQSMLPLNPEGMGDVPFWIAVNTAVSFMTNTNWQSYSGEAVMSMFTQMAGLGVQNFVSAATGMSVIVALARAFRSRSVQEIGNFWIDATRSVVYILLPLSFVVGLLLISQGVVQSFDAYQTVTTLSGSEQVIPGGPVASHVAIKQLGTNGGGYFGVNSSHPLENPTPLSNFIELLCILLIPVATPYMYGRMVGSARHGWIVTAVMASIVVVGLCTAYWAEASGASSMGLSSMMEGKETRFGVGGSVLWSVFTTAASNGSVNAMHDSMSPLSGMVQMFSMQIGEVAFGGVGAGMYGMLIFIILTVFISGLMVGKTPEYLGKKIEAHEVRMAVIAVLAPSVMILGCTALASVHPAGLAAIHNGGPHGFSEVLYAFSSATGNNGSAFGGYGAATDLVAIMTSLAMLVGRFAVILPLLAIAGSVAAKKTSEASTGTFRTDQSLFGLLLLGVIVVIGALTFLPALSLGPIADHLLFVTGHRF